VLIVILTDSSKIYYGVRIVSGDYENNLSSGGIHLNLVGSTGATEKLKIHTHIKVNTNLDVLIEADGKLGNVQVVIFEKSKGLFEHNENWFINYSIVYTYPGNTTEEKLFPCYRWIGDGESMSTTSATSKLSLLASQACETLLGIIPKLSRKSYCPENVQNIPHFQEK